MWKRHKSTRYLFTERKAKKKSKGKQKYHWYFPRRCFEWSSCYELWHRYHWNQNVHFFLHFCSSIHDCCIQYLVLWIENETIFLTKCTIFIHTSNIQWVIYPFEISKRMHRKHNQCWGHHASTSVDCAWIFEQNQMKWMFDRYFMGIFMWTHFVWLCAQSVCAHKSKWREIFARNQMSSQLFISLYYCIFHRNSMELWHEHTDTFFTHEHIATEEQNRHNKMKFFLHVLRVPTKFNRQPMLHTPYSILLVWLLRGICAYHWCLCLD